MARGKITDLNKEIEGFGSIDISSLKKKNTEALKLEEEYLDKAQKLLKAHIRINGKIREEEQEEISRLLYSKAQEIVNKEKESHVNRLNQKKEFLREELELESDHAKKISLLITNARLGMAKAAGTALVNTFQSASKGLDEYIGAYSKYFTGIETRLLDSGKSYDSVTDMISRAVGQSSVISQMDVMDRVSDYISKGIAFNVELRAVLGSLSDKIATTFNPLDGTLVRLIRIQQFDSTQARLGMENAMTRFFNSMFKDTQYLSGLSDSVASAIMDASAMLGGQAAVEFDFAVQKWLGSFYSVGVSEQAINMIASGIGMLGSGNISGIAGNPALQNLLVSAARNADKDFGSMLTGGLNAETVNLLLGGLFEQTQSMVSSGDMVAMQQMANLFGMSLTDLKAISNLDVNTIKDITSTTLNYSQAMEVLNRELKLLDNRVIMKERVDNVFKNIMASIGEEVANNSFLYGTWLSADLLEKVSGGISIPFVSVLGSGVDLNTTVAELMKVGVFGAGALSKLIGAISSADRIGGLNLGSLTTDSFRSRGIGFDISPESNMARGTSQTMSIGSGGDVSVFETEAKMKQVQSSTEDPEAEEEVQNRRKVYKYIGEHFSESGALYRAIISIQDDINEIKFNGIRITGI